jgi:enamine deaminase RidA (YjgF/YER057c/UK114 family)
VGDKGGCATVLRRFAGPHANELAVHCRPEGGETVRQAEGAYHTLAEVLAREGASFGDLASETLFLRDIRRDLPLVLDVRARVLADVGQHVSAPSPGFIQQAPIARDVPFEVLGSAVVPRDRRAASTRDVRGEPICSCAGCARSGARLVRLGNETSLHSTNVYGVGDDAYEQALGMFDAAERLLAQCGMDIHDVVRTWIHLRHIDRDYDALNRARREFFHRRGIAPRPASTGVSGGPFPDGHDVSLRIQAITHPLDVAVMSTPTLNEAWSYGADFSRGLRVVEANKVTLHVAGTASVDEAGRTAHVGDFGAQVERMLHNIASLLERHGATVADVVSGITYVKRPSDAPALRAIYRSRGFDGFPCPLLEAPLCRPDLLCEAEVVAMLPLTT